MPIADEKQKKVVLSVKDYQALLEAYQKLGKVLFGPVKQRPLNRLSSLADRIKSPKMSEAEIEQEIEAFRKSKN